MIGRFTDLAMYASALGLTYEQLRWKRTKEGYSEVRSQAEELINEMEIEGAQLPKELNVFAQRNSEIEKRILDHLSSARSYILGDTVALPFYWLNVATYRACALAMQGKKYSVLSGILEDCLEDLGLERRFVDNLESELDWVRPSGEEDLAVSERDVIRTGSRFVMDVIKTWTNTVELGSDISKLHLMIRNLEEQIHESREESRESARRLEELITSKNEEILEYLGAVRQKLIDAGLSDNEAIAITQGDPEGFWERFDRWQAKKPWRNAVEEAMWEAFDFVPGGTGVKLGIRIVRAIRKSLKGEL